MDEASRVSRVVGAGVWPDGELSVAPRTSVWLGETKLVWASWARSGFPILGPPNSPKKCVDYTEGVKSIEFKRT